MVALAGLQTFPLGTSACGGCGGGTGWGWGEASWSARAVLQGRRD